MCFCDTLCSTVIFISAIQKNVLVRRKKTNKTVLVLTSLIRLQLSLQVLRGHIKVLLLALSRPWFTSSTAAVTAATQAATEVTASGQATQYKQSL